MLQRISGLFAALARPYGALGGINSSSSGSRGAGTPWSNHCRPAPQPPLLFATRLLRFGLDQRQLSVVAAVQHVDSVGAGFAEYQELVLLAFELHRRFVDGH